MNSDWIPHDGGETLGHPANTITREQLFEMLATSESILMDVASIFGMTLAPGPTPAEGDPVNHPPHYKAHPSGVECITITEHMNFCRGNAMKYIWRAGEKGSELEDLKKARWYLDREIQRLERVVREGEDRHEPPAPPAPPPPRLIKEDVPLFPMNEGEQT